MIVDNLSYNDGDYIIDDEAEEIENAMQDLIEDEGNDIDRVAELSDEDYEEDDNEYSEDNYDDEEDYIDYDVEY